LNNAWDVVICNFSEIVVNNIYRPFKNQEFLNFFFIYIHFTYLFENLKIVNKYYRKRGTFSNFVVAIYVIFNWIIIKNIFIESVRGEETCVAKTTTSKH